MRPSDAVSFTRAMRWRTRAALRCGTASSRRSNSSRGTPSCSSSQRCACRTAASSWCCRSGATPGRSAISRQACFTMTTESIRRAYSSQRSSPWAGTSVSGTFVVLPGGHWTGEVRCGLARSARLRASTARALSSHIRLGHTTRWAARRLPCRCGPGASCPRCPAGCGARNTGGSVCPGPPVRTLPAPVRGRPHPTLAPPLGPDARAARGAGTGCPRPTRPAPPRLGRTRSWLEGLGCEARLRPRTSRTGGRRCSRRGRGGRTGGGARRGPSSGRSGRPGRCTASSSAGGRSLRAADRTRTCRARAGAGRRPARTSTAAAAAAPPSPRRPGPPSGSAACHPAKDPRLHPSPS
jgi:hypothetical protein